MAPTSRIIKAKSVPPGRRAESPHKIYNTAQRERMIKGYVTQYFNPFKKSRLRTLILDFLFVQNKLQPLIRDPLSLPTTLSHPLPLMFMKDNDDGERWEEFD